MKRAHIFQHVPYEEPGIIEPWLRESGFEIKYTQFFRSPDLPDTDTIDFLVVLGGPMSVNDENEYPWLIAEKEFIRRTIQKRVPLLGICLGAQLIASALGSNVFPNPEKEIGWFPVRGLSSKNSSYFQFPYNFECFHWHGETFDLPDKAERLASSDGCKNQAFQIEKNIVGLQFHLEMTPQTIQKITKNCRDEIIPSRYIQTESEVLKIKPDRFHTMYQIMNQLLQYLTTK